MEQVIGTWLTFKKVFWSEYFWLPPNKGWDTLKRNETVFYPDANDLYFPIPMAIGLLVLRLLWERLIAVPIGRWYKIKEMPPRKVEHNEVLEQAFKQYRRLLPSHTVVTGLSKQIDWTPRRIEYWWHIRRLQGKPSEMQRFRETSWRFIFYFAAFWMGLYVLLDKPWFWDTLHCWYDYPEQAVSGDIWWYYMLELSFYWSLVLSLFMDIKRKDFTEMIIHHIATITLLSMSWSANMVRGGTLVLCIHDAVDYILEFAKLTKYCKYSKLCDVLFVIFAAVFFITRLVIYPFRILRSTLFEATTVVGMAPIYYAYNGLLCVLQVLHVFWFLTILRMAYKFIKSGEIEKDARSDSEEDQSVDCLSDEEEKKLRTDIGDTIPNQKLQNGAIKRGLVNKKS